MNINYNEVKSKFEDLKKIQDAKGWEAYSLAQKELVNKYLNDKYNSITIYGTTYKVGNRIVAHFMDHITGIITDIDVYFDLCTYNIGYTITMQDDHSRALQIDNTLNIELVQGDEYLIICEDIKGKYFKNNVKTFDSAILNANKFAEREDIKTVAIDNYINGIFTGNTNIKAI